MRGLMIALLAVAGTGSCQDPPPVTVSVESLVASRYLWRGFVLNDSLSAQPAVTIGYRGFSFTAWESFSRTAPHGQAWTEHDFLLDYSRPVGKFNLLAGFAEYFFTDLKPEESNRSREVYVGLSRSGLLNPALRVYRDVKSGSGNYYQASVNHAVPLRKFSLNASLSAGLNQHLYVTQTVISDVTGSLALDIPLTEHVKLTPQFTEAVGHRSLFGHHAVFGAKLSYSR